MTEALILFGRTVAMYVAVFLTMRIMGKREIGKLSLFDLVISIMIAEIAVFVLEDIERPWVNGLLPMTTLVGLQLLIAWLTLKSRKLRLRLDGEPSVLIKNGNIDREEMKRQRYNLDDLILQLRENKTYNLSDVEFALLETSGKLTVIEKQKEEANIRYKPLPIPLIMDGKVQDQNLEMVGQTRFWLKNELRKQGVRDFKDVFLCSLDHNGKLYVSLKK
ncbi:DUF421 domain-containing protein [Paenibacillus thermoaerophilus]|uniref:DUF421 domain-containing protein n=1 Tax=Paenibacillus thermoaerophilus TaxID=1215385 RepID=A0ABW2UX47_9BACL|nr:DUF421 domain-containing protein [Paenibacillus thermoaerophilus]TMV17312.1 DUF421 domain-containing protein [Paenibacillus thermoaerophilus]